MKNNIGNYRKEIIVGVILVIAVLSRFIGLGKYPGGTNVDEAFAGYEAWSLLNYGTDSWGIHNPVYLTVWGSGMSVLNSLLMIPFIKLLGLNTLTIRLPQALIGAISVYVFYLLMKKISNEKLAVIGMFLMAICPWHIMMSRFGLDCNMAVGFLMMATLFFVKGLEKEKWLIISALFYGLSLYCYATVWIVVPILLLIWGIYAFSYKKMRVSGYFIAAVAVLFVMALPLILFVAVNMEWIEPINGSVISIPRLVEFRGDEVGSSNLMHNIKKLVKLCITQDDGLIWNVIPYFGMYYLFSAPFIIIGVVLYVKKMISNFKDGIFGFEFLMFVWCVVAAAIAVMQGVNVNRINNIHIPVMVLWTVGVAWFVDKVKKNIGKIVIVIYAISFICFEGYYYTSYQQQISERQLAGADKAIEEAMGKQSEYNLEKIYITGSLRHSQVLFYTEYPTDKYLETVKWQNYPNKYLVAAYFGDFEWVSLEEDFDNDSLNGNAAYIIMKDNAQDFVDLGWNVDMYDYVGVAYKNSADS